jgi:3'-5' exonuclease
VSAIVFDIETGALPRADLAEIVPTFEAPSNWKDPAKINAYVAEKQAEWFQSAALSATTGRVLAIGHFDTSVDTIGFFASGDERADLAAFWRFVTSFGSLRADLVGFNSNRFDLPFLIRRSWRLGLAIPPIFTAGRFLPSGCIDILDTWRCGVRDESISLDSLARFLGVGRKTGDGAEFAALWSMSRDSALEYLAHDLRLTRGCAEALGLITPANAHLSL